MNLRAILFDVNGTLIDIKTEEGNEDIYSSISRFLIYQGIALTSAEIRALYFATMKSQRLAGGEQFPEFDAVSIWREILERHWSEGTVSLPKGKCEQLPLFLAELHRALAMKRLQSYPEVASVLRHLKSRYLLAVITDAQSAYSEAELSAVGLSRFFSEIVVSGDRGFRKPDPRLFTEALNRLHVLPEQAIFVGNDMYRDIFGAKQAGMKTVFFPTESGEKHHESTEPDYIIYRFSQLLEAIAFLSER